MRQTEHEPCEVCGREGKAAARCEFQYGCSCWLGIPCRPGVSARKAALTQYWSERQERAQLAKHDPWGEGR